MNYDRSAPEIFSLCFISGLNHKGAYVEMRRIERKLMHLFKVFKFLSFVISVFLVSFPFYAFVYS